MLTKYNKGKGKAKPKYKKTEAMKYRKGES